MVAVLWKVRNRQCGELVGVLQAGQCILTPKNMFLLESKPAANIRAFEGSQRLTRMRHAKRDIVLCITFASFLSPGSVSITTKSMGDSEERPTCI